MGVASYQEDDLTRFLESTEAPLVFKPLSPPRHYCPFCVESFANRHALTDHLSSSHWGDRPVLVIRGREPDRRSTIRQPVRSEDITIGNCSHVLARLNGGRLQHLAPHRVPVLLSRESDAVVDLELVNCFDEVATPIHQPYRLTLRIPEKASLDAVDRAFIEHLATSAPQLAQVDAFLQDPRCAGLVGEYADALGVYVRGLLVKDQAIGTGVTLPPSEADEFYGAALEGLKGFNRPLAAVVCGLVRFAFNDFGYVDKRTGFRRLDRCNTVLAPLLGVQVARVTRMAEGKAGSVVKLCPVDQAIDRILDLAERLDRQTRWGPSLLEDCRQAAEAQTLAARDRVKVHALWAATALQLEANEPALEPLRQLRATYPFGAWASGQLDRMEERRNGGKRE